MQPRKHDKRRSPANAPHDRNPHRAASDRGGTPNLEGGWRPGQLLWLLIPVAVLASVQAHWHALSAKALTFDDNQYLTENTLVNQPSAFSAWRFLSEVLHPSTVQGYYQPLAMISLMTDAAMGGSEANLRPFHRTSLALHAANTALIVILLNQLFGSVWPAVIAGLLFGTHPMTVEPIPWVGERKTLLAAFFALISLILYVRYTRLSASRPTGITNAGAPPMPHCSQSSGTHGKNINAGTQRTATFALAGCIVAYVLALLSKPTSTMLPIVMLLLDFWPLRRFGRRAVVEKIPLYLITVVSSIITVLSQKNTATIAAPGDHYSASRILLTLCHNIVFYPSKMLAPVNLSSHYPYPQPMSISQPTLLWGVIGTIVLLAALAISLRWTRALAVGWMIFFAAIFPTMGVIGFTNVIASDKYAYLPAIGFLIVLTWGLTKLWSRFTGRIEAFKGVIVLLAGITAYGETFRTWGYLDHWQTTESLFTHMLSLTPDAVTLHNNYSVFLIEQGRFAEAEVHCRKAVAGKPHDADARLNLVIAYAQQGGYDKAIQECRQALSDEPEHVKARTVMGGLLLRTAKTLLEQAKRDGSAQMSGKAAEALDEAATHCREAIRLAPSGASAYNYLGLVLVMRGEFSQAMEQYRKAVELAPASLDVRNNLGNALARNKDYPAAVEQFQQIIAAGQDVTASSSDPLITGDWAARQRQMEGLRINARVNMGIALAKWGKKAEAAQTLREALRIAPGHPQALAELRAVEENATESRH